MENIVLRRGKILYDNDHFVNVAIVQGGEAEDEGYVVIVQIDDFTYYPYRSTLSMSTAYELYHECLVDIFSTTFDELMENFHDSEVVEKVYEETLDALNLSKETFGHKKPSKMFDIIPDKSLIEIVIKHPTFKS